MRLKLNRRRGFGAAAALSTDQPLQELLRRGGDRNQIRQKLVQDIAAVQARIDAINQQLNEQARQLRALAVQHGTPQHKALAERQITALEQQAQPQLDALEAQRLELQRELDLLPGDPLKYPDGPDAWARDMGLSLDRDAKTTWYHVEWYFARNGQRVGVIPGLHELYKSLPLRGSEHTTDDVQVGKDGIPGAPVRVKDLHWYLSGWIGLKRDPYITLAGSTFQQEFFKDAVTYVQIYSPMGGAAMGVFEYSAAEVTAMAAGFTATVASTLGAGIWIAAVGALVHVVVRSINAITEYDKRWAALHVAYEKYLDAFGGEPPPIPVQKPPPPTQQPQQPQPPIDYTAPRYPLAKPQPQRQNWLPVLLAGGAAAGLVLWLRSRHP